MMRQLIAEGATELVIQKSDLFILAVATAGLTVGLMRWHDNTQNVDAVTIPASSTVVIAAPEMPPEPDTVKVVAAADQSTNTSIDATLVQTTTLEAPTVIEAPSNSTTTIELYEYVVQSGDVLSRIAVQNDTDVATLQRLNGISGSTIRPGQVLVYPATVQN